MRVGSPLAHSYQQADIATTGVLPFAYSHAGDEQQGQVLSFAYKRAANFPLPLAPINNRCVARVAPT